MARITFSSLFRRAVQSHSTSEVIVLLVSLQHPSFGTKRFAANNEDITSNGFIYMAAPGMDVQLIADNDEDAVIGSQVSLPDIDNQLVDEIENLYATAAPARQYMLATISIVLAATPNRVEHEAPELQVRTINKKDGFLMGQLDTEAIDNQAWPYAIITPADFPFVF